LNRLFNRLFGCLLFSFFPYFSPFFFFPCVKVLVTYGYGSSMPNTAKRRLRQSVAMARQLLATEKENKQLKAAQQSHALEMKRLQEQLEAASGAVQVSAQRERARTTTKKTRRTK
jgi:hypothetical protein